MCTVRVTSDTAIQHISESVFVGLCRTLGTAQVVAMRRDVMEIREMVNNQVGTNFWYSMIFSGSRKEGFRLQGSDLDCMLWLNNHRVIWKLSQSQYYNTHRQTLILSDCSDSPPGFTLLYFLSPSRSERIQRSCVRMYNRYYLSSSKFRRILCSESTDDCVEHGPCISSGTRETDGAYCFVCDFWPPSASSWINRCHSWPQPQIVDEIVKSGCHLVAIGHKLGRHEDHEWRISFSLAEQKLMYAVNHSQFLTYGLLKLFLTEIINNGVADDDKLLCSYHMKTAFFWVIQQNTKPQWCPKHLLDCFWVCFKLILKWVYEGVCPNFFIPDNNMFLNKINGEKQQQLFTRLFGLYEKGITFLLHSPSIRPYILNVFPSHRFPICTYDQNLVSEIELGAHLCMEIEVLDDPLKEVNIQNSMKYLRTIEQMIALPLLTQNQVFMLQKLAANVLCETAFMLHMKTYTLKNKLKYRADKISCHMLKLACKFGFVTDMIYIAMYYYKTLRYMEALSIIEMIKLKLAQAQMLYKFNVDTEKYIKAVGVRSWSTKVRQAVPWDIKLNNKIHYICELSLEQQSALQNGMISLFIPPFILLYMLEILCYRHLDTMEVLTALDDLHTLVHYHQRQFIQVNRRDLSWQILGICQQATGNFQTALYSYQQSLRQVPYHKIQSATQRRIHEICR